MNKIKTPPVKSKRLYITKKRLESLHTAISLDDILYEKFKRLEKDIDRRANQYLRQPKRLWKVIQRKNGNDYLLKVIRVVIDTNQGSIVYVD